MRYERSARLASSARILGVAALALLAAACATGGTQQTGASADGSAEATRVVVENHNWSVVHAYALQFGRSASLGQVATGQTRTFTLPAGFSAESGELRLAVETIGGNGADITRQILFEPGDVIHYELETDLSFATVTVEPRS